MIEGHGRRMLLCVLLIGGILFGSVCLGNGRKAIAQSEGPIWGRPYNISNSKNASVTPAIMCDAFGAVHVFWSEKTQGEPSGAPGHEVGDSIFYRRLQNGEWSSGIDVAFADQNELYLTQPVAAADSSGTLYLIWSGYRGIYFSSAPIASATSAAAWSPPAWVVRIDPMASFSGPVKRPRLIVDEARRSLYAIYSLYGTNGNLFYLRSTDLGETWDEPRVLTDVTLATSSTVVNANGRIALDRSGNIHIIWDYVVKEGEDWLGKAIKHTVSTDNGDTWSTPTDVAVPWQGTIWWGVPDVVATSDKLHVVFACGDRPRRCYTYSQDGGETWARPQRLFGDYMSLAGWDSVTVDVNDKVHLIAQLRDLQSQTFIWYATLESTGWPAEPSKIPYDPTLADHFPESCISPSNELHFVLDHESQGEVWYMSGQLYPMGSSALVLPTSTSVPIASSTVEAKATEAPARAESPKVGDIPTSAGQDASASILIIISVLPVLLLIAGVALYRWSRR